MSGIRFSDQFFPRPFHCNIFTIKKKLPINIQYFFIVILISHYQTTPVLVTLKSINFSKNRF